MDTTTEKILKVNTFPIEGALERILFYDGLRLAKEAGYTHVENDSYFQCLFGPEDRTLSPIEKHDIDQAMELFKPTKREYSHVYGIGDAPRDFNYHKYNRKMDRIGDKDYDEEE